LHFNERKSTVKIRVILTALLTAAVLLSGCQQKKKKVIAAPPASPKPAIVEPLPFTPAADSSVSVEQVHGWLSCNSALDSLSEAYKDSFKTEDISLRMAMQNNFSRAQAVVCVKHGLKSGYDEYRWVTGALASPRNKALRDSFNLGLH
jgi:hypothetical protein